MLVTSCLDNICRLWSETLLPEDGVVSMTQLDPNAAKDCKFRTHRQKARFIQRFRHMRQSYTARKGGGKSCAGATNKPTGSVRPEPIASLPSTYSVHEFHNYGYQSTGISPGLHFHLAATINALTDIPLVPTMAAPTGTNKGQHNFMLHWLNNKEMQFSLEAEKIMEDLFKLSLDRDDTSLELELAVPATEDMTDSGSLGSPMKGVPPRPLNSRRGKRPIDGVMPHTASSNSLAQSDVSQSGSGGHHGSVGSGHHHNINLSDMLDHRIDRILKDWHQNSDLLFSVHPIDGSLLVWVADFLDEYQPGSFRQAQVSFSSRIPNAIPLGDSMTMGGNVELFNAYNILNFKELVKDKVGDDKLDGMKDEERKNEEEENDDDDEEMEIKVPKPVGDEPHNPPSERLLPKYKPPPIVSMISKHNNGTLNLWNVMFAEKSKFSQLLNISHGARCSGHRFRVNGITCHPVLPLLLTTSHHNIVKNQEDLTNNQEVFRSELILWRVDPVGPLSKSGGITELARINSMEISAFSDVAWIPTLLPR